LEGQKELLETQFDPESQEYLDEVARIDEEIGQVGIDTATGEPVKDWEKNKKAYDAAKSALDKAEKAKATREEAAANAAEQKRLQEEAAEASRKALEIEFTKIRLQAIIDNAEGTFSEDEVADATTELAEYDAEAIEIER
jgi:hypothetical protein